MFSSFDSFNACTLTEYLCPDASCLQISATDILDSFISALKRNDEDFDFNSFLTTTTTNSDLTQQILGNINYLKKEVAGFREDVLLDTIQHLRCKNIQLERRLDQLIVDSREMKNDDSDQSRDTEWRKNMILSFPEVGQSEECMFCFNVGLPTKGKSILSDLSFMRSLSLLIIAEVFEMKKLLRTCLQSVDPGAACIAQTSGGECARPSESGWDSEGLAAHARSVNFSGTSPMASSFIIKVSCPLVANPPKCANSAIAVKVSSKFSPKPRSFLSLFPFVPHSHAADSPRRALRCPAPCMHRRPSSPCRPPIPRPAQLRPLRPPRPPCRAGPLRPRERNRTRRRSAGSQRTPSPLWIPDALRLRGTARAPIGAPPR